MKNLLLTAVLMLAVIFSSNATNDIPSKRYLFQVQEQHFLSHSTIWHLKPIRIRPEILSPMAVSVVAVASVA